MGSIPGIRSRSLPRALPGLNMPAWPATRHNTTRRLCRLGPLFARPRRTYSRGVVTRIIALSVGLSWLGAFPRALPAARENRPAAVDHLRIGLVRDVAFSEAEVDTLRDQLTRIWFREGVAIALVDAPVPAGALRLVLTGATIHVTAATRNLCDLGATRFVDGVPDPELRVSVTAAREFVRQARPDWPPAIRTLVAARVIGRAAAHELGHYLLGVSEHRPKGLMRAHFDGADLLGPNLGAFAPPRRVDVEAGVVRAAEPPSR